MSVSNTNVFRRAENLEISPEFAPYTGVRILTGLVDDDGNDIVYESGDETGRVLEISSEWGTQTQADNILARITGRVYKPYSAEKAILDPAAELNDGIAINGVYSGLCSKIQHFGALMNADISAPQAEEIDHEYVFETPQDRQYTRELRETKAELKIQASQIAARVTSSGGNSSSFGWVLTDHDHSWYSGSNMVMRVNASGLLVNGLIEAVEFRTASGETLATSSQLETIRQYSGGSYSGDNGFIRVMGAAQGFNLATQRNSGVYPGLFQATHIDCGSISVVNTSPFGGSSGLMAAIQIMMNGMYHRNTIDDVGVSASGSCSLPSQGTFWVENVDGGIWQISIPGFSGSCSVSGSTSRFNYVSWDDGS